MVSTQDAKLLQYIGSPFTNIADCGVPGRIGSGNTEPTIWKYIRIQGQLTCNGAGAAEVIALADPLAWPFPILQSDCAPSVPWVNIPQTGSDVQAIKDCISSINQQIDLKYPQLQDRLVATAPIETRFAFGGMRVWSLAGDDQPTGIIRAAPLDSGLLHRVLMGNAEKHGFLCVNNSTGGVSATIAPSNPLFHNMQMGLFANSVAPWNLPGLLNQTVVANQTNWMNYLTDVATLCEYTGEYKIYEGTLGASVRFNPTEDFAAPTLAYPRWFSLVETGAWEYTVSNAVEPLIRAQYLSINGLEGTTLTGYSQMGSSFTPAGETPVFQFYSSGNIGPVKYVGYKVINDADFNAQPNVPITLPCMYADISAGLFPTATCFVAAGNGMLTQWDFNNTTMNTDSDALIVYNAGLSNPPSSRVFARTGGPQFNPVLSGGGVFFCSYKTFKTGIPDDHHINGNWSSARINLTGFQPNQTLFTEVVFAYEDVPLQPDPLNAVAPVMRANNDYLLALLSDRNAFPIISKGHSFFTKVRDAIAKAMSGLQTATKIVGAASQVMALL